MQLAGWAGCSPSRAPLTSTALHPVTGDFLHCASGPARRAAAQTSAPLGPFYRKNATELRGPPPCAGYWPQTRPPSRTALSGVPRGSPHGRRAHVRGTLSTQTVHQSNFNHCLVPHKTHNRGVHALPGQRPRLLSALPYKKQRQAPSRAAQGATRSLGMLYGVDWVFNPELCRYSGIKMEHNF